MTGKQIVILIIVVIVIFILLNVFLKKKNNTNSSTSNTNTNHSNGVGGSIVDNLPLVGFPLKKGSIGMNVSTLQAYLNSKGASLDVDGIFGNLTLAALKQYTGLSEVSQTYFNTNIVTGNNSTTNTNNNPPSSNNNSVYTKYYAKANGMNSYNSPVISSTTIAYMNYSKDEYVGDFLGTESYGSILKLVNNDNSIIYVLANQVYSK